MLEFRDVSRLGFGGYRVSINSPDHVRAIEKAISSGCNLIDTAPNYSNGQSELLIGSQISTLDRSRVFVITKVGYVGPEDNSFLRDAESKFVGNEAALSQHIAHCIHPDFLLYKIGKSLERLNCKYIDGFLLHNPENLFADNDLTRDEYLQRVVDAFCCMEELVHKGIVRYYGISSNALPASGCGITLHDYLGCARAVSHRAKFRILQFPFNLAEWDAAKLDVSNQSLLTQAKLNNLVSIANRPLNAKVGDSFVRLIGTNESNAINNIKEIAEDAFAVLKANMANLGIEGELETLPQIIRLKERLCSLTTSDEVSDLLHATLRPIVEVIFPNVMPTDARDALHKFERHLNLLAHENMASIARLFVQQEVVKERIGVFESKKIQFVACKALLEAGVDHVLVGMRRAEYVSDFISLFKHRGH
jgi:aryl-alcohol dehydrogenase-like predicted oxidoreductase